MSKEKQPIFKNNDTPSNPNFYGTTQLTPEQLEQMLLEAGIDVRLDGPYIVLQPNATKEEMENVKEAVGQLYYDASDGFNLKVRKIEHEQRQR